MAGKIKKTRPELLKQRRTLASYERYLPTLVLKKQQIQMEVLKVRAEQSRLKLAIERRIDSADRWLALFSESLPGPVTRLVGVKGVRLGEVNVAGIPLPVLLEVDYEVKPYSVFATAPWVDAGIAFLRELLGLRERIKVCRAQEEALQRELRKVSQRVNLFEKVLVPRAKANIHLIRIQLAEEETAAVGRAKLAKGKTSGGEAAA